MNIVPLGDRVVVEREQAGEKTVGGIVLPDTARDKPRRGTVVSVGEGRVGKDGKRKALTVKKGDHVLFSTYAGDEMPFKYNDRDVILLREEDILAVID